jgi:hypothetical protein
MGIRGKEKRFIADLGCSAGPRWNVARSHEHVIPGKAPRNSFVRHQIPDADRGIQLRLFRAPSLAEETADADGSMPDETRGSAESGFLGRRHGAVHAAEIDAAPSPE